jgi:putative ABC transport system permease protein
MFFRLLMESFRRQRRRKLLAGIAILLGTTAVTAMLALATTIGDRIHKELAVYGANIVVYPKADLLEVKVGGVDVKPASGGAYLKESDLEKLKTIFWANNITGVSPELDWKGDASRQADPRLYSPMKDLAGKEHFVLDKKHLPLPEALATTPVMVKGLWFDHSFGSLRTGAPQLHPWWHLQGLWPVMPKGFAEVTGAVVGQKLAEKLGLKLGDTFSIMTPQIYKASLSNIFSVTGIVSTGDQTDNLVLIPLEYAQFLVGSDDAISRVDISARTKPEDAFARKDPDTLSPQDHEIWYCRPYANSIAYQIREAVPGAQAEQVRRVEQSEGNVLKRISGLMWLISAAALLAAGFAVSAAMATAILERRGEIGLMRSLGASKGAIAFLFYAETGLLAVFAGTLGYLAGSGLAAWLGARIFRGDGGAAESVLIPVLLPVVVTLALVVAIAGSTPSIRAALRMEPSAILREDG